MRETIIQFGSGNFLRGFVGHFVNILNEKRLYNGSIVVVQPTSGGKTQILNEQGGRYTLCLRGISNSQTVDERIDISCVSRGVDPYSDFDEYLSLAAQPQLRFIVSNTTEAGIAFDRSCRFGDAPAASFPGKLTQLLYKRFTLGLRGFIILACELIDGNALRLKECVLKYAKLWRLEDDFSQWIEQENIFAETLVDRIVTGYDETLANEVKLKTGREDKLLDVAEPFHLWVIGGYFERELPLKAAGINVIWTKDVSRYKKIKVRILNGAHTSLVFPSLLSGMTTVRESMEDEVLSAFSHSVLKNCVLPVLGGGEECAGFANKVRERFSNPFINHLWSSISLNSVSKFTVRVLPTLIEYEKSFGKAPTELIFSLACLINYYKNYEPNDDETAVDFIKNSGVDDILANKSLWGEDISRFAPLTSELCGRIADDGAKETAKWLLKS